MTSARSFIACALLCAGLVFLALPGRNAPTNRVDTASASYDFPFAEVTTLPPTTTTTESPPEVPRATPSAPQTPSPARTYSGDPAANRELGRQMAAARGWTGGEWDCLDALFARESGWRADAGGPEGAYGIPQSYPGTKMAAAGADWLTNPETQLRWGLDLYIGPRYGSPCGAWAHSQATGWY